MRNTRLIDRISRHYLTAFPKYDFSTDNLIIGGGIIGLAIAERLSRNRHRSTLLVEKNANLGEETRYVAKLILNIYPIQTNSFLLPIETISSRNSEVIHAGIYYPENFLKTRLCIRGKNLLYELCQSTLVIPFRRVGKWIVSRNDSESEYLESLKKTADKLGVDTYFVSRSERERQEPDVNAHEALCSPTTGIIDSHALMGYLATKIKENGGDIALKAKVGSISKNEDGGYLVNVSSPGTQAVIRSENVINAAGLYSDKIANMILPGHVYRLYYAKGHYYCYSGLSDIKVNRLIYPVPERHIVGVGTHLTLDLSGAIRFGPDVLYVDTPDDYDIVDDNGERTEQVWKAVTSYLPKIKKEKLYPGYTGIRPKLQGPGEGFRDFVIKEESDHGLNGFINLVGIESPGLTASLAIAEMVEGILDKH
ncbi:7854_t:CDS:1 [Paraglomus brasilianum]|uniref:L-2-hydroxyglutarate dehydrogenase, mitochondrial n=1 Tax=Paraglomus brasilianum TaxID=144538 RepID=A0A9N9FGH5_9GLOM|nr:7854_t:CDS:1 [Paraglomus brasilianum]